MKKITVEIEWHNAAAEKPDTDTTVLVGFDDGECECGYYDSARDCWRGEHDVAFAGAKVIAWADLPRVPEEQEWHRQDARAAKGEGT